MASPTILSLEEKRKLGSDSEDSEDDDRPIGSTEKKRSPAATARVWGSALDNFFKSSEFEDQKLTPGEWHKPRTNASKLAVLNRRRVATTKKCLADPGVSMSRSGTKRPRRKVKELSSGSSSSDAPPPRKRTQRLRKGRKPQFSDDDDEDDDDDEPLNKRFGKKERSRGVVGLTDAFNLSDDEEEDLPPVSRGRGMRRRQNRRGRQAEEKEEESESEATSSSSESSGGDGESVGEEEESDEEDEMVVRFPGDGYDSDIEEPSEKQSIPKIEKIIARRVLGRGFEYLCKFAHQSYLHAQWVPSEEMVDLDGDQRSTKMRNFNQKYHRGSNGDTPQRHAHLKDAAYPGSGMINPAYVTVEKILALRLADSGATEYLCKWYGLGYAESTWEGASDVETAARLTERGRGLEEIMGEFRGENDPSRRGVMDFDVSLKMRTGATAGFSKACGKEDEDKKALVYCTVRKPWEKGTEAESARQLFEFQVQGITWMLMRWEKGSGFILADEMGLGKTIQTSVTLSHIRACLLNNSPKRAARMPFLVVAPVSTLVNWKREIEAWTPLTVTVYHGTKKDRAVIRRYEWPTCRLEPTRQSCIINRQKAEEFPKFDVLICSYETLSAELDNFTAFQWCAGVFDEAHRLKSVGSRMREACSRVPCLSRFLLTGTPIQNNIGEMWSLLNLANETLWPEDGREAFLETYGDMKDGQTALKLKKEVACCMIQRRKADVLAHLIPAKREVIINVEMTAAQREIYKAVYSRNIQKLMSSGDGEKKGGGPSLINLAMELRKCCNHPFLITGVEEQLTSRLKGDQDAINQLLVSASGKMVFLEKLIDKLLAEGEKVLVFSQFTMQLDIIDDYLRARGVRFERLDGNVSAGDRQEAVDRFNRSTPSPSPSPSVSPSPEDEANDGVVGVDDFSSMVFLLSTKAGGVGLNLCAASVAVIFDSDWNPQNDLQAMARCHRIGQVKNVQVYRLLTRNTYEERMFAVASHKLALERAVMSGLEARSGAKKSASGGNPLTVQEMDRLLKEGAYAVAEDNSEEERKFCAEDFDEIIRNRATTIDTEDAAQSSAWNGVSKATFGTSEGVEMPSMDDPEFWTKMAEAGGIDLGQQSLGEECEEEGEAGGSTVDTLPRRGRGGGIVDREEYKPESDGEEDSDDDKRSGGKGRRKRKARAKATPKVKPVAAKAKRTPPSSGGRSRTKKSTTTTNADKKGTGIGLPKGQRSIADFFLAKPREGPGLSGG